MKNSTSYSTSEEGTPIRKRTVFKYALFLHFKLFIGLCVVHFLLTPHSATTLLGINLVTVATGFVAVILAPLNLLVWIFYQKLDGLILPAVLLMTSLSGVMWASVITIIKMKRIELAKNNSCVPLEETIGEEGWSVSWSSLMKLFDAKFSEEKMKPTRSKSNIAPRLIKPVNERFTFIMVWLCHLVLSIGIGVFFILISFQAGMSASSTSSDSEILGIAMLVIAIIITPFNGFVFLYYSELDGWILPSLFLMTFLSGAMWALIITKLKVRKRKRAVALLSNACEVDAKQFNEAKGDMDARQSQLRVELLLSLS